MKKNAKAKNSEINKYQRGTGGGPAPYIKLSDTDQEIISLQIPTSLSGDEKISESVIVFDFNMNKNDGISCDTERFSVNSENNNNIKV